MTAFLIGLLSVFCAANQLEPVEVTLQMWKKGKVDTFCPDTSLKLELDQYERGLKAAGYMPVSYLLFGSHRCVVAICPGSDASATVLPNEKIFESLYIASREGIARCYLSKMK